MGRADAGNSGCDGSSPSSEAEAVEPFGAVVGGHHLSHRLFSVLLLLLLELVLDLLHIHVCLIAANCGFLQKYF